jgi:hypothetical protein
MLRRYHIVDLDDPRRAGKKASVYRGCKQNIIKGDFGEPPRTPEIQGLRRRRR